VKHQTVNKKNYLLSLVPLALLILTLLTGCVEYDVGVNISSLHKGEIVQTIKLGEHLKNLSGDIVTEWLNSIESRAKKLEGKVKRVSDQELIVTIPFNNGAELEKKYNQFFNPVANEKAQFVASTDANVPELKSQLTLKQGNYLLWVRNHLVYDLDLRSLSLASAKGVAIDPGASVDLEFRLNTAGGARSITEAENSITPKIDQQGKQLVWQLKPGELNHLEAVFWLPSPLGIGAVLIALFVFVGRYIKYQFLTPKKPTSPAIPQS